MVDEDIRQRHLTKRDSETDEKIEEEISEEKPEVAPEVKPKGTKLTTTTQNVSTLHFILTVLYFS